jgi:hypothetical protein
MHECVRRTWGSRAWLVPWGSFRMCGSVGPSDSLPRLALLPGCLSACRLHLGGGQFGGLGESATLDPCILEIPLEAGCCAGPVVHCGAETQTQTHTHRHTQTHRHTPTLTMHSSQIEAERVGPIGVVVSPTDSFLFFHTSVVHIPDTGSGCTHIEWMFDETALGFHCCELVCESIQHWFKVTASTHTLTI